MRLERDEQAPEAGLRGAADEAAAHLRPAQDGLPHLARRRLAESERALVARGIPVPAEGEGERAVLIDDADRLVAVAERAGDRWQPRVVLQDG